MTTNQISFSLEEAENIWPKIAIGNAKNITNQKFNYLTPIYRTNNINKATAWVAKCDCGNYIKVSSTNLQSNHTKSCGCLFKKASLREDLVGQVFNKLTVLEWNQSKQKWKCQCECGNITYVCTHHLKIGHTKSCGCYKKINMSNISLLYEGYRDYSKDLKSKGEEKIIEIFEKNNISFKYQVTFSDLRNPATNHLLRFDFGILDNNSQIIKLIEFNGRQHYDKKSRYYSVDGIERDNLKINYCKKNNIPLLIIKYNENILNKLSNFLEFTLK